MSSLVRTVAIIATAGCTGIGIILIILVFLYKPNNVEEIEFVIQEHQRPKQIDYNEIKNLFSRELPKFDFSRTTTQENTSTHSTMTSTTSIISSQSSMGANCFFFMCKYFKNYISKSG